MFMKCIVVYIFSPIFAPVHCSMFSFLSWMFFPFFIAVCGPFYLINLINDFFPRILPRFPPFLRRLGQGSLQLRALYRSYVSI